MEQPSLNQCICGKCDPDEGMMPECRLPSGWSPEAAAAETRMEDLKRQLLEAEAKRGSALRAENERLTRERDEQAEELAVLRRVRVLPSERRVKELEAALEKAQAEAGQLRSGLGWALKNLRQGCAGTRESERLWNAARDALDATTAGRGWVGPERLRELLGLAWSKGYVAGIAGDGSHDLHRDVDTLLAEVNER